MLQRLRVELSSRMVELQVSPPPRQAWEDETDYTLSILEEVEAAERRAAEVDDGGNRPVLRTLLAVVLALAVSPVMADEPAGPPAPPSREDVIAASFPSFVPAEARETRMRTSRALVLSLTACDVVSTFTAKGREIHPLAFGNKYAGVTLSTLSSLTALKLEERALRNHNRRRANWIRGIRLASLAFACGFNIRGSF